MSAALGAVAGGLGVIVLRAAVANSSNAAAGESAVVKLAAAFVDPGVPAIPQVAKSTAAGTAGAQTGTVPGGATVPLPNTALLPPGKKSVNVASTVIPSSQGDPGYVL